MGLDDARIRAGKGLIGAYEKLLNSYIEVLLERDELLERVKELEGKDE